MFLPFCFTSSNLLSILLTFDMKCYLNIPCKKTKNIRISICKNVKTIRIKKEFFSSYFSEIFIPKNHIPKYKVLKMRNKIKKSILVVDDEPDVRQSVKMILEMNGYQVTEAVDGDDCLKKIKEKKPDLILLDIMMPGTPVSEVVKQIKNIKIAFMSVVRISDARKKGLTTQDNIVDFLQKPFNVSDLIERVKIHLE